MGSRAHLYLYFPAATLGIGGKESYHHSPVLECIRLVIALDIWC